MTTRNVLENSSTTIKLPVVGSIAMPAGLQKLADEPTPSAGDICGAEPANVVTTTGAAGGAAGEAAATGETASASNDEDDKPPRTKFASPAVPHSSTAAQPIAGGAHCTHALALQAELPSLGSDIGTETPLALRKLPPASASAPLALPKASGTKEAPAGAFTVENATTPSAAVPER